MAVGEEMALQAMMPDESRTAVRAFVSLGFVVGTARRLR